MSSSGAEGLELYTFSTWVLPVVFSIVLHEIAHGYAAFMLGDPTAKERNRLSLNPLKHVDPFGTVVFPGALFLTGSPFVFGWAKPVPISFERLKGRFGMVLVSLAGPMTNVLLAVCFAWVLKAMLGDGPFLPEESGWLADNAFNFMMINFVLAAFNLFPLPPLDGGRVLEGLLPRSFSPAFRSLERYGFFIVIGLFLLPSFLGKQYDFIGRFIRFVVEGLVDTPLFPSIPMY